MANGNSDNRSEKNGFWKRQFAPTPTNPQLTFDVAFGVIAPILCYFFDPVVFRDDFHSGGGALSQYQLLAYLVSAIEIGTLVVWLVIGSHLRSWSPLIGGVLISGALFSAAIGFAILPLSLIGLLLFIGVFGFTPFFTALVYLRTGWRALGPGVGAQRFVVGPLLRGAFIALALPALASLQVSRVVSTSFEAILSGDSKQAEVAANRLKWLPVISEQNLDRIVQAYLKESDEQKKAVLKRSYFEITRRDIEARVRD